MTFSYIFDTIEGGYNYSKSIRNNMEKIYGSPFTYPTLSSRLDNLKSVADVEKSSASEFYEEWKVKVSEELLQKLLEKTKYKALNIMLRLQSNPKSGSIVTVKYSADVNALK